MLIIIRVTPLNTFFPWIEKQGLTIDHHFNHRGNGAHRQRHASRLNPAALVCKLEITGGDRGGDFCFVAGRARRYADEQQPSLVAGLLVGTVLGVALFRGVPVGPLIAAGLVSLFIGKS